MSRAEMVAVLAVAIVSPFERPLPIDMPGGLLLTTVEAAVMVAFIVFIVVRIANRSIVWRSPLTAPGVALLGVMLVAALAAPDHRAHALRFVGRLVAAAAVCLLAMNVVRSPARAHRLVDTLLAVGAVIGIIAVLEAARVPAVLEGLRAFRPGFHVVGGQVRATSTFVYPTIASMYLEVVFALGLTRLLDAKGAQRLCYVTALAIVGMGVIATFTRAGLVSLALTLGVAVCAVFACSRHRTRDLTTVGALAAILVLLVRLSWSPDVLRTRFATDTAQAWYGASYDVPSTAQMRTGSTERVAIAVENRGMLSWRSDADPPFAVSYHWLGADGEEVLQFDGLRTAFPGEIRPGERARLSAAVRAPGEPGTYVLAWDVVQEHRTWLSVEGVPTGRTHVTVKGRPAGEAMSSPVSRLPAASSRAPRLELWRAAAALAGERPLIGRGPDTFRFVYGPFLGLSSWDTRVHANSLYLDTLVGAGLVGLVALLWLLTAAGLTSVGAWRAASPVRMPLVAGITAAWLSIVGHGVVDTFLAFTPTYVIFGLVAGLTGSAALTTAGASHADRV